jgi:hypothetical protein
MVSMTYKVNGVDIYKQSRMLTFFSRLNNPLCKPPIIIDPDNPTYSVHASPEVTAPKKSGKIDMHEQRFSPKRKAKGEEEEPVPNKNYPTDSTRGNNVDLYI